MSARMNVILFFPDQWRGEALGCIGNPVVRTPHTDALAAEGVAFSNCFTPNGVCTPARCSLLTGWFPHVAGHRTMHHFVRRHEPNLMRYLKDAGYFVWWGGKNDAIPLDETELSCDFRTWGRGTTGPTKPPPKMRDRHFYTFYRGCIGEGPMHIDDDDVVDQAVEFLSGRAFPPGPSLWDPESHRDERRVPSGREARRDLAARHDKPFFMWINQGLPHPPYGAEREWCDLYPVETLSPLKPRVVDGKPGILEAIRRKAGLDRLTDDEFRQILATYYAMVSRVDRNFGRVIDAVKRNALWENTAILMTSDHGDFAGDYHMVEKTQNTFEDVLTRVPLVVRVPAAASRPEGTRLSSRWDSGSLREGPRGRVKGKLSDALVQSMDVFATIMELTGTEVRHTQFSRSLMPVVRGEADEVRDAVFCEGGARVEELHTHENRHSHTPDHPYHPRITIQNENPQLHGKAVMLRTHDWKYVRRLYDTDELYDLRNDPDELKNLVGVPEHAEVVREMRDRLLTWLLDTGDAVPFEWDARWSGEQLLKEGKSAPDKESR